MGADVTICGINRNELDAAMTEILQYAICRRQKFCRILLDLTADYATIEKALNVTDCKNPIYMLVNCDETAIRGSVEDITDEELDHMMKLNFMGTFNWIKAVIPWMKSRREGILVLTSPRHGNS